MLLSSRYWTEPVRLLARASAQLLGLRNDAVSWLINRHHNRGRRRDEVKRLNSLVEELAAGPRAPLNDETAGNRNNAMEALRDAVTVIRDIAAAEAPDLRDMRSLGSRCRNAVASLSKARQGNVPTLPTAGDPLPELLDEMFMLLADILIARAEQRANPSDFPRRAGSESWVDVADRGVGTVACAGYQAEKEALESALGMPRTGWEIHRVRHPDMKSAWLLTDRWVLVVSLEADAPDLPALFNRMTPETMERLAFRTFVVFGETGGGFLPAYAFKLGASKWWSASDAELLDVASGLGTGVISSPQLQAWDAFLTKLVAASRAASLLRLRQQAGLVGDEDAFEIRLDAARSAAEACHPALQAEAGRLLSRVESEPYGEGRSLAGEVYRLTTHSEQSDDVVALEALRVQALLLDLEEVRPSGEAGWYIGQ